MPDATPRFPPPHDLPLDVERRAVERAADGDQQAIGELYDAYVGPLYRFCVSRVGNETDAEDLTEEIFLKVMRALGGFEWRPFTGGVDGLEERSPFRAWLFRIARNHVVSHYRRATLRGTSGEVPEWLPDEQPGPQELAERALTIAEVFSAVEALPTAQREVIQLRFGAGLSIAETAEALEKQQTNVKVLQHKGIKRLREILEARASMNTQPQSL